MENKQNSKNRKRRLRQKNDTLIKWFQLANTIYLNQEEFGATVRQVMIHDDKEGKRYENLTEEAIEELKEAEKKWKEEFETLKLRNPMVKAGFNSLCLQVNKSTESFNNLAKRLNKDDDNDDDDEEKEITVPEVVEPSSSFEIMISGLSVIFENLNTEKPLLFPKKSDIENYISELQDKKIEDYEIAEILDELAAKIKDDKCNLHWMKYKRDIEIKHDI